MVGLDRYRRRVVRRRRRYRPSRAREALVSRLWDHLRLGPMTSGAKRGLAYLVVVGILINAGVYYLSARSVNKLSVQQHAQCRFYADLGSLPIAVGVNGKASIVAVTIVSDARVAWHRLGCTGTLQPADPSFLQWAAYYKLPTD
jgi:hypothetical protein